MQKNFLFKTGIKMSCFRDFYPGGGFEIKAETNSVLCKL
jgi:hypothetical protein